MNKCTRFEVSPSLYVTRGKDGHWLQVKANGKSGAFNLEAVLHGITRSAFVAWADRVLESSCPCCLGYGAVDAPYSGSDPSCPECEGSGVVQDKL